MCSQACGARCWCDPALTLCGFAFAFVPAMHCIQRHCSFHVQTLPVSSCKLNCKYVPTRVGPQQLQQGGVILSVFAAFTQQGAGAGGGAVVHRRGGGRPAGNRVLGHGVRVGGARRDSRRTVRKCVYLCKKRSSHTPRYTLIKVLRIKEDSNPRYDRFLQTRKQSNGWPFLHQSQMRLIKQKSILT